MPKAIVGQKSKCQCANVEKRVTRGKSWKTAEKTPSPCCGGLGVGSAALCSHLKISIKHSAKIQARNFFLSLMGVMPPVIIGSGAHLGFLPGCVDGSKPRSQFQCSMPRCELGVGSVSFPIDIQANTEAEVNGVWMVCLFRGSKASSQEVFGCVGFVFFGSPFNVVVRDDVGKSVQQSQKTNIRLWGPPAPAHQVVEQ